MLEWRVNSHQALEWIQEDLKKVLVMNLNHLHEYETLVEKIVLELSRIREASEKFRKAENQK